ncbi:Oryzin [Dactylella cylindrospora]|nr:Oryzin [Dactylella cylindrospora]
MQLLTTLSFLGAVLPLIAAAPVSSVLDVAPASSAVPQAGLVPGKKYIVVLKDTITAQELHDHTIWAGKVQTRNLRKRQEQGSPISIELMGVEKTFNINKFKAYAGAFDQDTLDEIEGSEEVEYIEEDQPAYVAEWVEQIPAPWGLSDISNQQSNASRYRYDSSAGEGMYAYIVDSGINIGHVDFEGRAEIGYNALPDIENTDTSGHGTHVSAIVIGKQFGVAKKARVVNVKVFSGRSTAASTVIDGFNWAVNDILEKGRQDIAVINLSLTTGVSKAFNSAVDNAYEQGIISVVASGNYNLPASEYSPASATTALTVGAVSAGHIRGNYSNYGPAVKIMAPGTKITSAGIANSTATRTTTGTSQAAPHVAGLICYLRKLENLTVAADVVERLFKISRKGVLDEDTLVGSPNLLAYNGNGW